MKWLFNRFPILRWIVGSIALLFGAKLAVAAQDLKILTANPQQGSMIIGQYTGQGQVFFDERQLTRDKDGIFVFGVGRESPAQVELIVRYGEKNRVVPVSIQPRQWQIERVDGLPAETVSPKSPEVLARIAKEAKLVRNARDYNSAYNYFKMSFIMPAQGRISGVYGSQRILNGQPKNPHFGLDVANKTGTAVIAPAKGVVTLVYDDMFYSGGTLVIDHGHGISSSYIHLHSINVSVGQTVEQGDPIATIGATGRATGPHLDWRLNWFQTRLDPQLLINSQPM